MIPIESLRQAQRRWASVPLRERLRTVRRLRALIASEARALAKASADARARPASESLTAEVLPLIEACRFLERSAEDILAPRPLGRRGLPFWLGEVRSEIHREPLGVILIIGPGNYPLFLPGVQAIQALVAGNAVFLKPGAGGGAAAESLVRLMHRAGFEAEAVHLLPEDVESATTAIDARPDKILFTGSDGVAAKVLERAAPLAIPCVIEASGRDAVVLRADADLDLAAKAIHFALELNGGATCMVPRRLFAHRAVADEISRRLTASGDALETIPFTDDEEVATKVNDCEYGLGASIFTADEAAGRNLARRLEVGLVTINDLIVSSADPRLPFGGRRRSGFGLTRGAEGLLEMTAVKAVTVTRGKFRPAFDPVTPRKAGWLFRYTRLVHATGIRRLLNLKNP